jgi:hypothetical protein
VICKGLVSTDANVRKHMSRLVNKVLRFNPSAFAPLCAGIRNEKSAENSADRRTSALLAVFKAAKSLSLVAANYGKFLESNIIWILSVPRT